MIILYNFSEAHFGIACTGLKDCSFYFGFNTHSEGIQEIPPGTGQFKLPSIIQPFFDANHYSFGKTTAPIRIGIPTIEDGNVYGPSELAIYNWLFFGEKSYATIVPVGPASLIDSILHAPSKILRAVSSRPIDKLYIPMGVGIFPVIDSAHCLDMIRWMLRVAFWNRDHAEDPRNFGHPLPASRITTITTPLNQPMNSRIANHDMRMCYWLASGPGFNTLGLLGFNASARQLRELVISANHRAGYDVKEGIVIEASGAGDYAKFFGRTYQEMLAARRASGEDAASAPIRLQGGIAVPRRAQMTPIYLWELYQIWLRNIVSFNGEAPSNPLQYKHIKLSEAAQGAGTVPSDLIKTYFQKNYPYEFKFNMNLGMPDWDGQFYGKMYDHNKPPVNDWQGLIGRSITDRIRSRALTVRGG